MDANKTFLVNKILFLYSINKCIYIYLQNKILYTFSSKIIFFPTILFSKKNKVCTRVVNGSIFHTLKKRTHHFESEFFCMDLFQFYFQVKTKWFLFIFVPWRIIQINMGTKGAIITKTLTVYRIFVYICLFHLLK